MDDNNLDLCSMAHDWAVGYQLASIWKPSVLFRSSVTKGYTTISWCYCLTRRHKDMKIAQITGIHGEKNDLESSHVPGLHTARGLGPQTATPNSPTYSGASSNVPGPSEGIHSLWKAFKQRPHYTFWGPKGATCGLPAPLESSRGAGDSGLQERFGGGTPHWLPTGSCCPGAFANRRTTTARENWAFGARQSFVWQSIIWTRTETHCNVTVPLMLQPHALHCPATRPSIRNGSI